MEQGGIAIPRCPFVLYGPKRPPRLQSRGMKPRLYLLFLAAVLPASSITLRVPVRADSRATLSLTTLVAKNSLTRDTNADGLPDAEAATNLAPALGYDTTALSLPLVLRDADVPQPASIAAPILVGRENRFTK